MSLKGRDFLTLSDFEGKDLIELIDLAQKLKKEVKNNEFNEILKNKTLVMYFAKPSLRTRVSFEVGMKQMGGNTVILKQDEIVLGQRETISDTARVVSRYADCVMIRTFGHSDVEEFANYSSIPVINALTDDFHPCQVMADLLTIKEHFGSFEKLKLTYVGDGNNMANSLMIGCSLLGIDVSIASPKGYEPSEEIVKKAKSLNENCKILITNNPAEAIEGSSIVYTDVWVSMGQESEACERKEIFKSFQVNKELMEKADKEAIVLHCLPAHREEEISEEILEKHADVIFEQAENRLHAQKAILASIV